MCEERRTKRGPETWGLIRARAQRGKEDVTCSRKGIPEVGEGTVKPRAGAEDSKRGKHAVGETDLRS